ncbi:MFS transporter [Paraburkholderia sp. MM6662-R1]|uniref:MFS transporter n=1 Tax=Paraburkholderia sp. MM6662-R1 TaxID=2991066 RepID=UPI003D21CB34
MRQIDIHAMANEARLNAFHYRALIVCALIMMFDGYDLVVAGMALPWTMKEMVISSTSAGFLVSSALVGMMLGNVLLGTMADRIGRRWILAICVALFSLFTAAAGLCKDPVLFGVARLFAGLGLGGAMPNVVALMTEYAPQRVRNILVTLVFSGFSVGGMLAAALGRSLIESYGWRSVFIAAAAPVLLIPLIWKSTPESLPFLVRHGRHAELKRLASDISPSYRPSDDDMLVFTAPDVRCGMPIRQLFARGRCLSTLMFWLSCFICLFMVYALSSWLTTLMARAGHSSASALTFVLVMNFGGMLGAIVSGWLADRLNIRYVLTGMYLLAAVSITLLGHGALPVMLLYVLVCLSGAATIGTQNLTNAYAGQFYPIGIRTTGVGWMLGVGRGGAILSPIAIGALVSPGQSLQQCFWAIGAPGLVAALAILLIRQRHTPSVASERGGVLSDDEMVSNHL